MNILITGGSGFLGRHIISTLSPQHSFTTVGRGQENEIRVDLSSAVPAITKQVDCVIHAAGKAHMVPQTEQEKQDFYNVNLKGTQNLCEGLNNLPSPPSYFVFISTVAVYGVEEGQLIPESHPLNADTPYGKSKVEAEKFLTNWAKDRKVNLSILRLPLIAGSKPPGNLGAMIKGISSGKYFNIGGGNARKSIVHANDVARLIPSLAQVNGTYNLTDGLHPTFAELAESISRQLGKKPIKNLPMFVARLMAMTGDLLGPKAPINSSRLQKITTTLTFDDQKARAELNWSPTAVLDSFKI